MASAPDWSSLPPELINRIAGCLLATSDVDHYMDLRAVCGSWRSTTDDPRNSSDPRFRPRHWIVVDEVFQSSARLLVNTATGRVLRMDLPLLRNRDLYYLVTTTPGGFFVLADRKSPHAVRVLNPFTGSLVRFAAPMPSGTGTGTAVKIHVAVVVGSSTPTLLLFSDSGRKLYKADPDSECFHAYEDDHKTYPFTRLLVLAAIYAGYGHGSAEPPLLSDDMTDKVFDLMYSFSIHPSEILALYPYNQFEAGHTDRCFLVESAGELLIIFKLPQRMEVFRMDTVRNVLEPVRSIGSRAIFLGYRSCVSVDADNFPSIDANCIYYIKCVDDDPWPSDIYMYDLKDEKEERVSGAINAINQIFLFNAQPPFTIIQLLSSYTINSNCDMEFEQKLEGLPQDIKVLSSYLEDIDFDDDIL